MASACLRAHLTTRSRRTAAPLLNSSVRPTWKTCKIFVRMTAQGSLPLSLPLEIGTLCEIMFACSAVQSSQGLCVTVLLRRGSTSPFLASRSPSTINLASIGFLQAMLRATSSICSLSKLTGHHFSGAPNNSFKAAPPPLNSSVRTHCDALRSSNQPRSRLSRVGLSLVCVACSRANS